MAGNIEDVVIVTVTKTSVQVSRAGFGTTLWLGQIDVAIQADRFQLYGSLQEMLDAGFTSAHNAYKWARVHLSAAPAKPQKFALGRRIPGIAENDEVEITAPDTGNWLATVNGTVFTYVAGALDTNETISAGLAAAITAGNEPVTAIQQAAPNEEFFDVQGIVGGQTQTVVITPGGAGTETTTNTPETAAELWATAYAAIHTASTQEDYYILNIEDRDKATVLEAAGVLGTSEKLGVFQSRDADFLAGTAGNVAITIKALSNRRACVFYTANDTNEVASGMSGFAAAIQLDSAASVATWNLVTLPEVLPDVLTTANKTAIKDSGGSYYLVIGGVSVTQTQSCEGEFMRVQSTLDWTKSRVAEKIFGTLAATTTKVDLDSTGIGTMEGDLKGVLNTGVKNGHFTSDFKPTAEGPAPEDIEEADKNAGILRDLIGVAKLAQAIRQVYVQVDVTV